MERVIVTIEVVDRSLRLVGYRVDGMDPPRHPLKLDDLVAFVARLAYRNPDMADDEMEQRLDDWLYAWLNERDAADEPEGGDE